MSGSCPARVLSSQHHLQKQLQNSPYHRYGFTGLGYFDFPCRISLDCGRIGVAIFRRRKIEYRYPAVLGPIPDILYSAAPSSSLFFELGLTLAVPSKGMGVSLHMYKQRQQIGVWIAYLVKHLDD